MVTSVVWTEEVGTSPGTLASYRLKIPHRESPQTSCAGRRGCVEASRPTLPFGSLIRICRDSVLVLVDHVDSPLRWQ